MSTGSESFATLEAHENAKFWSNVVLWFVSDILSCYLLLKGLGDLFSIRRHVLQLEKSCIWVFPKIMVPPNHPF